jgi:hypothetical protein
MIFLKKNKRQLKYKKGRVRKTWEIDKKERKKNKLINTKAP